MWCGEWGCMRAALAPSPPHLQGGPAQKLPAWCLAAPPRQSPAEQPERTHARRLLSAAHCLPTLAGRAQPEPTPAFRTMFKGLSKSSQGKGSPKGSPAKGSPKGSPNKHSR